MVPGLVFLLSALAVVPSPVLVQAEGACPAAEEVGAQLGALLRPLAVNRESARIETEGALLRIQVLDAQGMVLVERNLPTTGHSCAALARAAAVVIAAWMIDLHPELAPPAPSQGPAAPVRATAAPALVLTPPTPGDGSRIQASAGAGVSVSSDGWTPEGRLQLGWAAGPRLLLRLSLFGEGRRQVEVDAGSARYGLAALAPGMEWIFWGSGLRGSSASAWRLGFTADAHATFIRVEGQGFARNISSLSLEPRAASGLRLSWRRNGTELWLAAEARVWIRNQIASVTPDGTSKSLARWDFGFAVGGAFWR